MGMKLIRIKEVLDRTGLGRSTVYKYMSLGEFPQSIKLGTRAVAWVESEIEDWIRETIASRDGAAA